MAKKLVFTAQELADYFDGKSFSAIKAEAEKQCTAIRTHAEGTYPTDIIEEARPHESDEVRTYRKKIWKSKTKQVFMKVVNSLSKIRRSADWSIQYPEQTPARIPEGERLEDYCEKNYPYFDSITNWAFQVLLREYLIDPNSVLLVLPIYVPEDQTEFLKPYGIIYGSKDVIDYRHNDYCVAENPLGCTYTEDGQVKTGRSFYIMTTQDFFVYNQNSSKPTYKLALRYTHGIGYLPAYKLGAVLTKAVENDFLYESRVGSMIPSLDEAAREYSDLQAAKVMHIYPERWEITTRDCPECKGTGQIKLSQNALPVPCTKCDGRGSAGSSPYQKLIIKQSALDSATGSQIPVPPAGFVEKDVEIVKLQDEGVKAHLFEALAAVNMEFLAQIPLAESGVSKEVDRDETNNFVHSVAEDIVRIMDWLYYMIAKYRYGVQYTTDEQISEMMPSIEVPEHYDLFSTKFIEEELKSAKDNKLNPVLVSAMELSYASKKFNAEPDVKDMLVMILQLDPLANVSEDDKNSRLQNNGITQQDYVISSNIVQFVLRAMEEDKNFARKTLADKQAKMKEYAELIIASTSAKAEVLAGEEEDEEIIEDAQTT